jgi:hypothetical protein
MWFDPPGALLYVYYANAEVPWSGAPALICQAPLLTQNTFSFDEISIALGGPVDPDGPYIHEPCRDATAGDCDLLHLWLSGIGLA